MNRQALALLVAILMIASPLSIQAAEPEVNSSVIVGEGISTMKVAGEAEENGLIFQVREPVRKFDAWTAVAVNTTDAPITNLTITLEVLVDGAWYLPNADASERLMYPTVIEPGGFAFVALGSIGGTTMTWDDTRITVDSIDAPFKDDVVDLAVDEIAMSDERYVGAISNTSDVPVTHLTLVVGCVEDGELVGVQSYVSDILRLPPNDSEPFDFRIGETAQECSDGADVIATAVGRK